MQCRWNNSTAMLLILSVLLCILVRSKGQNVNNTATWCTISNEEQKKCEALSRAAYREIRSFGSSYVSLKCYQAFNKEECMTLLDEEKTHLTTLDAGEVFIAGRYHSLVPIMQEIHDNAFLHQYAVAVIKKGSLEDVQTLHNLRGKKACFAGVGTLAGWIMPIHTLMKDGGMEVIDCNNHVKSTIKYFGPSCAVNSLIDKYNPLGDNSDHLCKLCTGKVPVGKCTNADPYSGYEGAFLCLVEAGDIAFLVHTIVDQMTSTSSTINSVKKDQFELLCLDGTRKPIDDFRTCNWGNVTSRAVVTSSATNMETRILYQKFLKKAVQIFGNSSFNNNPTNLHGNEFHSRQGGFENRPGFENYSGGNGFDDTNNPDGYNQNYNYDNRNGYDRSFDGGQNGLNSWDAFGSNETNGLFNRDGTPYIPNDSATIHPIETFHLFESAPRYGTQYNLLFSDTARDFLQLGEKNQTYKGYLKESLDAILAVRHCPVSKMTLCVTSEPEMEKCVQMRTALKAQLLKPELICYLGQSQIHCMQAIRGGNADVVVLDAGDIYTAGLRYELIPFISEVYNLGTPDYYVVAVAKEEDDNTDLTYLKNKYTCHTGINTAAGWIYPLAYLISNGWIRSYGCDSVRAAAEYFTKSCVPGALSTEYNIGVPYDNMCDLCHGTNNRYCRRDASEVYFGHTGAFRCLVEGGGDVAFVKHTTVAENTNGKRREFWARNTFTKDFQLLCPDGTRLSTSEYRRCNLGKVPANAIVTRGGYYGYNDTQVQAFINLFIYAQQFYGRKEQDEFSFSMFYSPPPYSDLIFQDASQQLHVIPPEKRQFSAYLGPDFMRAKRIVDCAAGASSIGYSLFGTLVTAVFALTFTRQTISFF